MTNTGTPTKFELDYLRFLREVDLGTDPCVPVPHSHAIQINRCLARRGLANPERADGSGPARQLTEAGWALVATLPRMPRHAGCYHRCSRGKSR
jgi:hypothetical protein